MKLKLSIFALVLLLSSCSSAYYSTMENLGVHKRDILVDRVEEARDAQQDGQKQFESALDHFKSVVSVDAGELEKTYEKLNAEYDASVTSAEKISERIDSIENVADALFEEWEEELDRYSSKSLRRDSEQKLKATKRKYQQMLALMNASEKRIDPVLQAMEDQVLFLKHNLNTRAIDSLKPEIISIDNDVDRLVAALKQSITEANNFIAALKSDDV